MSTRHAGGHPVRVGHRLRPAQTIPEISHAFHPRHSPTAPGRLRRPCPDCAPLHRSESDPNRIYANNFGIVYRSDDGGRTWNDGVGVDARDMLADPDDSDTVYATTPEGLYVSRDAGATFELDETAPRMVLIATNSLGLLVGTSFDNTLVYQLPSGEWATGGEYEGAAQALTVTPGDEIALVDQRGVVTTRDFGTTWEEIFRPEPHT